MGCWISWLRACAAAKSDDCMQSLTALLERDTAFARLAPGVEQMAQLAADVSRLLPDGLAPHIFAGPVREGTLTLFAAHGALAARLRHLEPHLAQNLQRRGWPFTRSESGFASARPWFHPRLKQRAFRPPASLVWINCAGNSRLRRCRWRWPALLTVIFHSLLTHPQNHDRFHTFCAACFFR